MRAGVAFLVFLLDVAVLASILAVRMRLGRKLAWCAAVVLLPVVGAVAWLLRGRARTGTVAIRHE